MYLRIESFLLCSSRRSVLLRWKIRLKIEQADTIDPLFISGWNSTLVRIQQYLRWKTIYSFYFRQSLTIYGASFAILLTNKSKNKFHSSIGGWSIFYFLFILFYLYFLFFFIFTHSTYYVWKGTQKLVLKYCDFMLFVKDCFIFSLMIRIKIICEEKKIYCE